MKIDWKVPFFLAVIAGLGTWLTLDHRGRRPRRRPLAADLRLAAHAGRASLEQDLDSGLVSQRSRGITSIVLIS